MNSSTTGKETSSPSIHPLPLHTSKGIGNKGYRCQRHDNQSIHGVFTAIGDENRGDIGEVRNKPFGQQSELRAPREEHKLFCGV